MNQVWSASAAVLLRILHSSSWASSSTRTLLLGRWGANISATNCCLHRSRLGVLNDIKQEARTRPSMVTVFVSRVSRSNGAMLTVLKNTRRPLPWNSAPKTAVLSAGSLAMVPRGAGSGGSCLATCHQWDCDGLSWGSASRAMRSAWMRSATEGLDPSVPPPKGAPVPVARCAISIEIKSL